MENQTNNDDQLLNTFEADVKKVFDNFEPILHIPTVVVFCSLLKAGAEFVKDLYLSDIKENKD